MKTKDLSLFALFTISILIVLTSLQSFNTKPDFDEEVELAKKNSEIITPTPMFMYENIEKYSDKYRIPKHIAYNISFLETRYQGPFHWKYNPHQTSCVGALGPMQIMPGTARLIQRHSVSNDKLKNDIRLNIEISMKLLRKLHDIYHDWAIVCGCYNTGRPLVNDYAIFCSRTYDYQNNWIRPKAI
jgi:soluble lytic murein transglycosylase-like protein